MKELSVLLSVIACLLAGVPIWAILAVFIIVPVIYFAIEYKEYLLERIKVIWKIR